MAETMLGPTVFVIVLPSLEQYGIAIVIAQEERIPLSGNCQIVEARVGIEPTHKGFADLSLTTWVPRPCSIEQRSEPVHHGARASRKPGILERETGFEPATSTLARSHSTTELLPLSPFILQQFHFCAKFTAPAMHSRNVRRERFQAPRCTAPAHRVRLSAHGHNAPSCQSCSSAAYVR